MSRGISLLQDTFPVAPSSGITYEHALVLDTTNRGNAKLPASPPELTFIGAAAETPTASGDAVSVQIAGICVLQSDGAAVINPGDYLIVTGTTGQVRSQAIAVPAAPGTQANWNLYNIIGMCVDTAQIPAVAGSLVSVRMGPFLIFGA